MRAAGHTLTVGELREALEGLPDDRAVHVVPDGVDADGWDGDPVVAAHRQTFGVRLVASLAPTTELDDNVLDFLEQFARGKLVASVLTRETAADLLAGYGIRVNVRAKRA